jgi:hypothetical protein
MIFKILNKLFRVKKRFVYDDVDYFEYKNCHISKQIVYEKYLCFAFKSDMVVWDWVDYRRGASGKCYWIDLKDVLIMIARRRRELKNEKLD